MNSNVGQSVLRVTAAAHLARSSTIGTNNFSADHSPLNGSADLQLTRKESADHIARHRSAGTVADETGKTVPCELFCLSF